MYVHVHVYVYIDAVCDVELRSGTIPSIYSWTQGTSLLRSDTMLLLLGVQVY